MQEQIERIKNKIKELKNSDKNYKLFGSQTHGYKLNPVIPIDQIREFESTHKIILPDEYVAFLTQIGNGGVGPFYGLEPIQNSLFDGLDYKRPESLLNPSKPFIYTEPWNLEFAPTVNEEENEEQYEKELSAFDKKYYDKELMNGVIAICNYGCAISLNLVVNGEEYGKIWTDDRGNGNGIYPSHELGNKDRISFLDWYELWLDNSLQEIQRNAGRQNIKPEDRQDKKPWWKIW